MMLPPTLIHCCAAISVSTLPLLAAQIDIVLCDIVLAIHGNLSTCARTSSKMAQRAFAVLRDRLYESVAEYSQRVFNRSFV